jgi:hypothetical protein
LLAQRGQLLPQREVLQREVGPRSEGGPEGGEEGSKQTKHGAGVSTGLGIRSTRRGRSSFGKAAVALVWQGHMLDLQGRRDEAMAAYRLAVALGIEEETHHNQYGLGYQPSAYAEQRLLTPFTRVENNSP